MADAAIGFVLHNLHTIIKKHISSIVELRSHIDKMLLELPEMKNLIRAVDKKNNPDEVINAYASKIKDTINRIEDALEVFEVEIKPRRGLKRLLRIFGECYVSNKVGLEVHDILSQIESLKRAATRYSIDTSRSSENQRLHSDYRSCIGVVFVGMEEDIDRLVLELKDSKNSVVSIWGMRGTGKSSIAFKVFTCLFSGEEFKAFAWISEPKKFKLREILEFILFQLELGPVIKDLIVRDGVTSVEQMYKMQLDEFRDVYPHFVEMREKISRRRGKELIIELHKLQRQWGCLIVLDDMSSFDDWETLRVAFVSGEQTTVMITTRMQEVAEAAVARKGYLHSMRRLTAEESWELINKKAFPAHPPGTQEEWKELISNCGGLPVVVYEVGKLVAEELSSAVQEMTNLDNLRSTIEGRAVRAMGESYHELPYNLKQCLFYICQFPKDSDIEVEKLYHIWVAEGIISVEDVGEEDTAMDIAERYLTQLALLSLVQVQEWKVKTTTKLKSCRLQELMLRYCLSKDNDFMIICDSQNELADQVMPTNKTRQLALYLDDNDCIEYVLPSMDVNTKLLRCLLVHDEKPRESLRLPSEISHLLVFKLLRVLDFDGLLLGCSRD